MRTLETDHRHHTTAHASVAEFRDRTAWLRIAARSVVFRSSLHLSREFFRRTSDSEHQSFRLLELTRAKHHFAYKSISHPSHSCLSTRRRPQATGLRHVGKFFSRSRTAEWPTAGRVLGLRTTVPFRRPPRCCRFTRRRDREKLSMWQMVGRAARASSLCSVLSIWERQLARLAEP